MLENRLLSPELCLGIASIPPQDSITFYVGAQSHLKDSYFYSALHLILGLGGGGIRVSLWGILLSEYNC